jgi:hypothetical protein
MIRGVVTLPEGAEVTAGNLTVYLTHGCLGQEAFGGYPHVGTVVEDVDFADGPVTFELDMCPGGEMWTDEWGPYNLIAILDTNGNNTASTVKAPDQGEPSTRYFPVELLAGAESQCFTLTLDCTSGKDCISFEANPPECST